MMQLYRHTTGAYQRVTLFSTSVLKVKDSTASATARCKKFCNASCTNLIYPLISDPVRAPVRFFHY